MSVDLAAIPRLSAPMPTILGAELDVTVPVIDGLVAIASVAAGKDYRAEGRTLADWGLEGVGPDGLLKAVTGGWW